jgi:hypothetical protein
VCVMLSSFRGRSDVRSQSQGLLTAANARNVQRLISRCGNPRNSQGWVSPRGAVRKHAAVPTCGMASRLVAMFAPRISFSRIHPFATTHDPPVVQMKWSVPPLALK